MKKSLLYRLSVPTVIALLIAVMLAVNFLPVASQAATTVQSTRSASTSASASTGASATRGVTNDLTHKQAQKILRELQKMRLQKLHEQENEPAQKKRLVEAEIQKWAADQDNARTKETCEKYGQVLSAINESVPELANMIRDIADKGDFDHEAMAITVLNLASGILACVVPWGTIASVGINLALSIANEIMGGQPGPTAEDLMEDRLTQRIDQIADQVCEVQEQLADLSDQIAGAVDEIIAAIPTALENETDKQRMVDFMLSSGSTDFSYNQLRNYIYGATTDNRNAATAYYNQLLEAQHNGGSSDEIKYYYDKLYSCLMTERESFHDYIIGNEFGKSIVATYYDLISTRPDLTAEMGKSPEMAAVEFAYDLYQTELLMDQILMACNNYQYTYMMLNSQTSYDYGGSEMVFSSDILKEDGTYELADNLMTGVDELRTQFAIDLAYVLGTSDGYIVKSGDRYDYHETRVEEGTAYADVRPGQTVYFNNIPTVVCDRFDLDAKSFIYSGRGTIDNVGIVKVTEENKSSTFLLQYVDDEGNTHDIDKIIFSDADNSESFVGSGTAEDPYQISNADQFMAIQNGMDKHYRLIRDIDLGGKEIVPFGYSVNGVGSEVYEEFTGSLVGNGYTVSNFKIRTVQNSGLFAMIGSEGLVENLTLKDVTISGNISTTNGSATTYTGGILAGINNGYIYSCKVSQCTVAIISNTSNEGAERHVFFQYGGMVGANKSAIYAALVEKTTVDVNSTHTFGGGSVDANHNYVFVGGICGVCTGNLHYAGVDENIKLNATTKSVLSPEKKAEPYLKAIVGGITTNESLLTSNISNIYSNAKPENITADVDIDIVDSGRAERYANTTEEPHELIPLLDDSTRDAMKTEPEKVTAEFYTEDTYTVTITDTTEAYPVDATDLNFDKLEVTVNGETVSITKEDVLTMYGFYTYNESYTETKKDAENITLFFLTEIEENTVLLSGTFPISVAPNFVKKISVIDYKKVYVKGDAVDTEADLEVTDGNGKASTVFNAQVTVTDAENATAALGKKEIELNYGKASCKVEIDVLCNIHFSEFDYTNTDHYSYVKTVVPTCQNMGYDEYQCSCEAFTVQINPKPITTHTIVREVSTEATCAAPGVVGKIYCSTCNTVFQEQAVIPQLQHVVVNTGDAENHTCKNCKKEYAHEYVVSESIEDGVVTYTYTCAACGYVGVKNDTNIITFEERLKPAVVVSNGYALAGGDLVTVYVDLENNPGVNGANFGIRYSDGLELVGWYEGDFFKNTLGASNPVSGGYNFSWGTEEARTAENGNLLRLVFRVPWDATAEDEYTVSVVYTTVTKSEGGFALPSKRCAELGISSGIPQKFIIRDGVIRIVDRLPGDVTNDGVVNLLDALYLSNCLVNETEYPITDEVLHYGDVNLVGGITINDVVKVLQTISGGYGASILSPNYQIMLNTNGYTEYNPGTLTTQLYGANGTYAALATIEEAMQKREGYKFLGWYTRLEGGKKITDYATTPVRFDEDQKVQTLYAHWERNSVSFDMNGAPSSQLTTESYTENGEQWITLETPVEEYKVTFVDPGNPENNVKKTMTHSFDYWLGSDGVKYYAGDSFPVHRANMGNFTLTAVWGAWSLDIPALEKPGYDASQITWYTKNTNGLLDNPLGENPYDTIKAMADKILYGKWTKFLAYQVIYDGNGATSGSVPNSPHTYGVEAALSGNTNPGFKRQFTITYDYNYNSKKEKDTVDSIFNGWSLTQNGSIIEKLPVKDQPTVSGKNVRVYAQWTFGSADLILPARTGYTFAGWHTDSTCTNKFGDAGANYTPTGNITLYANWTKNKYAVSYDLSASTIKTTPSKGTGTYHEKLEYDSSYQLPVPTAPYYEFLGWYTSGGTQLTDATGQSLKVWDFASKTTVYAKWAQTEPSYTYIGSPEDFENMYSSGKYMLVKDIDFDNVPPYDSWIKASFSGELKGNGYSIKNLRISIPNSSAVNKIMPYGLFGIVGSGANIYDFNVYDSDINMESQHNGTGCVYAGFVAGCSSGKIKNIVLYDCSIAVHRDISAIGGIVGQLEAGGTIENCYALGIRMVGNGDIGGMTGVSRGAVSNCSINSSSKRNCHIEHYAVTNTRSVGGIVGYNENGSIKHAYVANTAFLLKGDLSKQTNMGIIVGNIAGGVIQTVGKQDGTVTMNWEGTMYEKNWLGYYKYDYRTNWFAEGWGYAGNQSGNLSIS